ncbi:hydrolase [Alicyclobacillus hesperidum subsp. aegles]|uniref:C40 family peptidase n=1 Tax=Alicyclobacillus hesperidum TaxID=89784 RepID=UPI00071917FC|nr:C40 family peptidase [Alicyclobacillus hesperidum]KRW92682.1 hydrolase Nlp/P60 [Alicyclobacillus tengchongensis]GLG00442.1 hydrolase [Alicyclobacillus hesperidum subsp. aegles]
MQIKSKWMYGVSAIVALSFVFFPRDIFANSLAEDQQKLAQLQSEKTTVEQQVQSDAAKELALKNAIATFDNSIHTVELQIETNHARMASLRAQEHQLGVQLAQNQQELETDQNELAQIVRSEYEDGNVSYLEVLFNATSFTDFLSRLYDLSVVSKTQNQVVQSVKTLQQAIVDKQNEVKASEQQVAQVEAQLQALQATDEALKGEKQHNLAVVEADIQSGKKQQGLLESQIQLTQSDIQAIQAATQAAEQQESNPQYVQQQQAALVPADPNSIIGYAEQFLGTPYVWGGTSPSGFDCSGFTQYVFAHFGVYISRTSEEQFAAGVPVSQNDLQPGDLVFFSTYAPGASHVGIYIGNGLMIDSQDMGVSIDSVFNSYWGPKYIGARRYITH